MKGLETREHDRIDLGKVLSFIGKSQSLRYNYRPSARCAFLPDSVRATNDEVSIGSGPPVSSSVEIPLPPLRFTTTPVLAQTLESSPGNSSSSPLAQRTDENDPPRDVNDDYKIPKSLLKLGLTCPYNYKKTFFSTEGIVNYKIYNEQETSQPLVVTFHGFNGTHMTFQDVQDVLTKYGFRVLTFDLYGHGLSAAPGFSMRKGNYGLDFFIRQTNELLAHLNMANEPLSLIGFSMGCCIACGYTKAHPDKVHRLVLISPAGMLEKKPVPVKCLRACPCCIHCFPFCVCKCCFKKKQFMQRFSKEERDSGMAEALWNRFMWQLFVKKGVIGALLGCVTRLPLWTAEPMFREVGAINLPVLILWGRQDALCPPSVATRVADCFPNGHVIMFKDATHPLLADQPQATIATILTFLEFPRASLMRDWKYVLPFNSKGNYVPRHMRCPTNMTLNEYQTWINYKGKYNVTLHSKESAAAESFVERFEKDKPSVGANSRNEVLTSGDGYGRERNTVTTIRRNTADDGNCVPVDLNNGGGGPYLVSVMTPQPPIPAQRPTMNDENANNPVILSSVISSRTSCGDQIVEPFPLQSLRSLNSGIDSAGMAVAPDFIFHSQPPLSSHPSMHGDARVSVQHTGKSADRASGNEATDLHGDELPGLNLTVERPASPL